MLEGLAAYILNTYIGEYIENLNTDQLSIGLLQGEVELENLPLKKDALKHLRLPIQIYSGFIGSIKLQIPVRRLRSEPWVISLKNLHIVVGPVSADKFDEDASDQADLEDKLCRLDLLEHQWTSQFNSKQEQSYYSASYSSWLSYGTSLISNTVDNIQLRIKDIHIRYEDNISSPGHPFAWGVIIGSLSAQSTDESWMPKFISGYVSEIARKLLELQDLAIYWDPQAQLCGDLPMKEFNDEMMKLSDTTIEGQHCYILGPVSAEAKLRRNTKQEPLRSLESPRFTCDLHLDKIPLTLTDRQFNNMVLWIRELEHLEQSLKHSKWRPTLSVKQSPRDWWQYAISYHVEKIQKMNHTRTWMFIMQRSRDVVLYSRAYAITLSGAEPLTAQMKAHKASVEQELSFEELKILRQNVTEKLSREKQASMTCANTTERRSSDDPVESSGQSLLQSWFPAWGGWYSTKSDTQKTETQTDIDKEILDVFDETDLISDDTFLKRDVAFARLNFCLRQGTLCLLSDNSMDSGPGPPHNKSSSDLNASATKQTTNSSFKSVFELEFSNLVAKLEYRPRFSSTMLQLSLGALYMMDKTTVDTAFPVLISPQQQDCGDSKSILSTGLRDSYSNLFSMSSGFTAINKQNLGPLFDVLYEVHPVGSSADYKLHINSRSLDVVYCPSAVQKITSFFSAASIFSGQKSNSRLTTAAKSKYESIKEQTREEIKHTWEHIIDGDHSNAVVWDLLFEISAPQFIVPSNMTDRNASLVVFDFGKLHFSSVSSKIHRQKPKTTLPDSDDEDDFHTPCSTPPDVLPTDRSEVDGFRKKYSVTSPLISSVLAGNTGAMSQSLIQEYFYDKYTLRLCDLQVLVGCIKDNWRYAHLRGTSSMHVIDRFSISVQLERRIVQTSDPQWPSATLSGNLPKLVVHINEAKIHSLRSCFSVLFGWSNNDVCDNNFSGSHTSGSFNQLTDDNLQKSTAQSSEYSASACNVGSNETPASHVEETSKLLMAEFCIDQVALQVQSRGQSITELQVSGVKTTFTKRPFDSSVNLTVHGLLLVDALQTFGPDFELLIASHKHVSMDSASGSLRDSNLASPQSPASPITVGSSQTCPQELKHALSNLQSDDAISHSATIPIGGSASSPPPSVVSPSFQPAWFTPSDIGNQQTEALITIEYNLINGANSNNSTSTTSSDSVQICSVLFNNLDIIANQETIVELLGFIKRVFPGSDHVESSQSANRSVSSTVNSNAMTAVNEDSSLSSMKTELSFDFHRLNVLLLRAIAKDGCMIGQKVATTTMTGAKIQASLGKDLKIEGALGGLQVIDLTPNGSKHQKILSVGFDPLCDAFDERRTHVGSTPSNVGQDYFSSNNFVQENVFENIVGTKALDFYVCKPDIGMNRSNAQSNYLDVKLRMASVCCVHSPQFLDSLQSCASEFTQYTQRLASSLKTAATEVAISIVNNRASDILPSLYNHGNEARSRNTSFLSPMCKDQSDGMLSVGDETRSCEVRLDVLLQTPIIVIPRFASSPEVLVGHLGRINVTNMYDNSYDEKHNVTTDNVFSGLSVECEPVACNDSVNIHLSNMNVYSLNVNDNITDIQRVTATDEQGVNTIGLSVEDLYDCRQHGQLIVHDTILELNVGKINDAGLVSETIDHTLNFMVDDNVDHSVNPNKITSLLQVTGKIVSELKVSVTKQQYQQIMDTQDNLVYVEPVKSGRNMTKNVEQQTKKTPVSAGNDVKNKSTNRSYSRTSESSDASTSSVRDTEKIGEEKTEAFGETFVDDDHVLSSQDGEKKMAVKILFSLPQLNVILRGDLGDGSNESVHGIVDIGFQDFLVHYQKDCPHLTSVQVSLKSLRVEDLLQDANSDHRFVMISYSQRNEGNAPNDVNTADTSDRNRLSLVNCASFLSTSCPEMANEKYGNFQQSSSLPNHLNTKNMFAQDQRQRRPHSKRNNDQSSQHIHSRSLSNQKLTEDWPQSTGNAKTSSVLDPLVHINILFVDKNCDEYINKYNRTNRFIDIDFNCLDTTINVKTLVMVLDFFGIGSDDLRDDLGINNDSSELTPLNLSDLNDKKDFVNSEIKLNIRSLSCKLNKPEYELTNANISNFVSHVSLTSRNFKIRGTLGSMSVIDLSPYGRLYDERFTTSGHQVLDFNIFKYGTKDVNLEREYDISVKLRMSSVCYIHTQRFQSETTAFFEHLTQLQVLLNEIRAAAAGYMTQDIIPRGSRVKLDIEADSPLIVIPMSCMSEECLVMDLGKLVVNNNFLFAGSPESISALYRQDSSSTSTNMRRRIDIDGFPSSMSQGIYGHLNQDVRLDSGLNDIRYVIEEEHVCLLDVMNIDLEQVNLYSAVRDCDKSSSGHKMFSSFTICKQGGQLLKKQFFLKLQVERNLDGAISHSVPDMSVKGMISSVHFSLDVDQYKLIRGLLMYNLGESMEEFEMPCNVLPESLSKASAVGIVWPCMSIHIDLMNVTIELLKSHMTDDSSESCLAQVDLIRSRLVYESFSDQSKDVDLVSQEILMSDTRFRDCPANARPNVFVNILQPMINTKSTSKSGINKKGILQAEIHYRSNAENACFTMLVNHMRIMGIFDWLISLNEFLMNNPDDPFVIMSNKESDEKSSILVQQLSPKSSKRPALRRKSTADHKEQCLELKLNIMDTELVVVEDTSSWDTNAVILKSTAVMSYKKSRLDKPLSCSLQSLEVFSCTLGLEDETALSIIDPVTVNVELTTPTSSASFGDDLASRESDPNTRRLLEVTMHTLNVRLSYYDMQMFCRIFDSVPKQVSFKKAEDVNLPANIQVPVEKLTVLGFHQNDCIEALRACDGHLNKAAIWLTQNSTPQASTEVDRYRLLVSDVQIVVACACLCLIDDCKDADVPLVELSLSELNLRNNVDEQPHIGHANFVVNSDYYNRQRSSWEPFVEPWRCEVNWTFNWNTKNLIIKINAADTLMLNVTSSLLDLYQSVSNIWTEDYYKNSMISTSDAGCSSATKISNSDRSPVGYYRRRSPFVPYALKNDTGCKLWFCTRTTTLTRMIEENPSSNVNKGGNEAWTEVLPDAEVPFIFESRTKMRNVNTRELKIHQIVVRVNGWQTISPVSVDKVGTYFRFTRREKSSYQRPSSNVDYETRIVFNVSLEGNARKVITVRSALLVANKLCNSVELKLEKRTTDQSNVMDYVMFVDANATRPLPINFVNSTIKVRPIDIPIGYCDQSISWQHVGRPDVPCNERRVCNPASQRLTAYRFCIQVKRENYPMESYSSSKQSMGMVAHVQPGHRITLVAPLTLTNLLPCELRYRIKDTDCISGKLKPGEDASLTSVNIGTNLGLFLKLDGFVKGAELTVQPDTVNFLAKLPVYDAKNRCLLVDVRVYNHIGGSLQVFVSVPYWLVNKTGLPLIFKQAGLTNDASGQVAEHEMARCVSPLMFSFTDSDMSAMCSMRLGKSLHNNGVPQWCTKFHLEKGVRVRPVRVSPLDSRPDWVYIIGIEVRCGHGRYSDTFIVTLAPRFQLENLSSRRLDVIQKFFAQNKQNDNHLLTLPDCSLPFHWPRIDLDQLLCIRFPDMPGCHWSGGIRIDKVDSFHVNLRDQECKIYFVHVEIVLEGATFFIVFSDAGKIPAPYRIENNSEVPIRFHQRDVHLDHLRTTVQPHCSVVYAWDEPMLPPYLSCAAPGGCSTVCNMNEFGEASHLSYENFIYISFTGTFFVKRGIEDDFQDLVLDVSHGTKVILSKKEPCNRSQLWRMSIRGHLEHEGSNPPRDPRRSNTETPEAARKRKLVLDIAGIGPQPVDYTALMLRKQDERRRSTQTWRFTEDGRMCCGHNNMFVQPKDGFNGLRAGNEVVLGPNQPVCFERMSNGIPVEQAVERQRYLAGSGMLSVKVVPDGPTRVLLVSDIKQKNSTANNMSPSDWVVVENKIQDASKFDIESCKEAQDDDSYQLQLFVNLGGGIGVSLINDQPEELMYALLHNIVLNYRRQSDSHSLEASVQTLQVDNQLMNAECPIVTFVTPVSSHRDVQKSLPAIHVEAVRVPTSNMNAEIFKHMIVNVKNMTLNVEEILLWKLMKFFKLGPADDRFDEDDDENNYQSHRSLTAVPSISNKRYYFSTLKIVLNVVRLSMLTNSKLPKHLLAMKKRIGWRLIQFEDATVELDPFIRIHPFETSSFLVNSVMEHYTEELKSQAAKILGSVDFLGNPLGLMNDVTEGVSTFINEGDVGGLLKNVTHGISNSAAKVTGSLSEGLGKVTMDDQHELFRQRIRSDYSTSSRQHLKAGLKGLGHGLIGGVTSLITQTYTGAANEGVQGFFAGIGKGLVGTVTKPAVGVLDLATSAASAVRDTSRSDMRAMPPRIRLPRLCLGPNGALPVYSMKQAQGQQYLYLINRRDYAESLIAFEVLLSGSKDELRVLISDKMLRIISYDSSSMSSNLVLGISYPDLFYCKYICVRNETVNDARHYIELTRRADGSSNCSENALKRPQVRCDNETIAQRVSQEINYAKTMSEEYRQSLTSNEH